MQRKTVNRWVNILLVAVLAALLFVPGAKALLITGLMKAGLFSPSIHEGAYPAGAGTIKDHNAAIKFMDATGREISLEQLEGKVVFLNFWATWCPPCQAEMPSINQLHAALAGTGVVFIMADADGDLEKAAKYMARKKFNLPVYKVTTEVPDALFDGSLPTTVIFNRKGQMVFKDTGAGNYAAPKVVAFLKKLAAE